MWNSAALLIIFGLKYILEIYVIKFDINMQ